jgi:lysyl-tRNA synthetase class 2
MLSTARDYFRARNVLEVETPVICATGVTDPHIRNISLTLNEQRCWLRTSPEYHMKRLLAAGSGDIYQIGKAFRGSETGRQHQPEFTMIEWYRLGFSLDQMIEETCQLIGELSRNTQASLRGYERIGYRDVFMQHSGIDPLDASVAELQAYCLSPDTAVCDERLAKSIGNDRLAWLDLIASAIIYPALQGDRLWVVDHYPADQAMLAQLTPANPATAERFEVFLRGTELANGFHELRDAKEQAKRFALDRAQRRSSGIEDLDADPKLLAALEAGLPDCSGVALGLDRLMMTTGDFDTISSTMSFAPAS